MCRNHRIKRLVPCRCRTGTLKNVGHEINARHQYLVLKGLYSGNLEYTDAGLMLLPDCAFIGASSDSLNFDPSMPIGKENGVLEMKCPSFLLTALRLMEWKLTTLH